MILTTTLKHLSEVVVFPRKKDFRVSLEYRFDDSEISNYFYMTIKDTLPTARHGGAESFLEEYFDLEFLPEDESRMPTVANAVAFMLSDNDNGAISAKVPFCGVFKSRRVCKYTDKLEKKINQIFSFVLKNFSREERQAMIEIFQILGRLYGFKVTIDNRCCLNSKDCCPDNHFK